jgi:hypothetical protein
MKSPTARFGAIDLFALAGGPGCFFFRILVVQDAHFRFG